MGDSTVKPVEYHFSSRKMTVWVQCDKPDGVITDGAPVIMKFVGQPLDNLRRWMKKQAGFVEVRYQ